ncbi:MAG: hypothetical protein Q9190_005822 [Brigantiaea leucoxantha]
MPSSFASRQAVRGRSAPPGITYFTRDSATSVAAKSSAHDTKPATKKYSKFLKLPGEVRNRIYEFVLVLNQSSTGPALLNLPRVSAEASIHLNTPLLYTCRQIYQEASFIFYRNNAFVSIILPGKVLPEVDRLGLHHAIRLWTNRCPRIAMSAEIGWPTRISHDSTFTIVLAHQDLPVLILLLWRIMHDSAYTRNREVKSHALKMTICLHQPHIITQEVWTRLAAIFIANPDTVKSVDLRTPRFFIHSSRPPRLHFNYEPAQLLTYCGYYLAFVRKLCIAQDFQLARDMSDLLSSRLWILWRRQHTICQNVPSSIWRSVFSMIYATAMYRIAILVKLEPNFSMSEVEYLEKSIPYTGVFSPIVIGGVPRLVIVPKEEESWYLAVLGYVRAHSCYIAAVHALLGLQVEIAEMWFKKGEAAGWPPSVRGLVSNVAKFGRKVIFDLEAAKENTNVDTDRMQSKLKDLVAFALDTETIEKFVHAAVDKDLSVDV